MKKLLGVGLLVVGCAQGERPKPPAEPVAPQLVARTGFLLQQLDARDRELTKLRDEIKRVKKTHEQTEADQYAELVVARAKIEKLTNELADAQELARTRAKQIVTAFSKGAGCTHEVETLTRERDQCYVELAEQLIPAPAVTRAAQQ